MSELSVGLQLYTVRDETEKDFQNTVRRVAQIGYKSVEFAGYGNLTASQMADLLQETGLQAASTHVGLYALEHDLEKELVYAQAVGCSYLVVPWLDPERRTTDGIKRLAQFLNEVAEHSMQHGITIGYHNHDFEFQQIDGHYLLDLLLAETDPQLVKLELDIYWAAFAGVDPIAYIRQHAQRIALLHLKDMTPERTFTELGDGTLDIAGICKVAQEQNIRWGFVENDQPVLPSLQSVTRSYENLTKILS